METNDTSFIIAGVDVSDVRNRNELRVWKNLKEALEQKGAPVLKPQGVRDAYALALNLLPARYTQSGTIVLREPIRESHLNEAVSRALKQVLHKPKE